MSHCGFCGKAIDRGKWCSDKCRKAHGRKVGQNLDKRRTKPKSDTQTRTRYNLPTLPHDDVLACNAGITWEDVLALSRQTIDAVYHEAEIMGIPTLLRLKRAAGYHRRVA